MGSASLNPSEIFRHFTCAVVLTEGEAAAGDVLLESIKKAKLTTVFMSHPLEAWAGLLRLELLGADLDHGAHQADWRWLLQSRHDALACRKQRRRLWRPRAPLERERHAGRVVERGDRVQKAGALTGGAQLRERRVSGLLTKPSPLLTLPLRLLTA